VNIGDVFLRILADDLGFRADVVKKAEAAGDAAGVTLGQAMGAAIKKHGAQLIGGTLALVGAIATRGILELQNLTADFRAETGATADEADRAGKAILGMSAHNIQPMQEIGKTLTRVYTDLHLVGDEAVATTQKFLTFGRATGQNAADSVGLFADILHAWNLTADRSGAIMDALVVSHQRYGGVIVDNEAALAALAPALIAANQTWQDGLALLNLFRESGVDSAVAVTAMTKALAKVHSPAELKAMIADIIATEDPFLRAAKATDLFGAKAGPKLANVLKPGIGGLEDYAVSADDAAGATQRAADVLDSTWGARFQLMIKAAASTIIGFGNDWAGVAQIVGTAGAAFGALGGGKLIDPIINGLRGAWAKVASSAIVTGAVSAVADKWSTVLLKGMFAADALEGALNGAWKRIAATSVGQAIIAGAASGRAFALAFAAAILLVPLVLGPIAQGLQDQHTKDVHDRLAKALKDGTDAALADAREYMKQQEALARATGSDSFLNMVLGERATFEAAVRQRIEDVKDANQTITESMAGAASSGAASAATLDAETSRYFWSVGAAATRMKRTIAANADAIKQKIKDLTATLLGEATAMINGYYDPIIAQDELRVQKDQVTADTIARNATKAGSAARHQADLTLANSQKTLDQTRLNLLAAGALSAKEQKTWLAELQAKYKTATGAAKTDIGELIAKIHELQHVPDTVIRISTVSGQGTHGPRRAGGGPVEAGKPYLVNENTPNSEIWVPEISGRVVGPSATPAVAANSSSHSTQITIHNPEPRAAEEDIARMMRRLAALGVGG
jgi:hypothetical protein